MTDIGPFLLMEEDRLYSTVVAPIALKQPPPPQEPEPEPPSCEWVEASNIAQVQAYVESHPDDCGAILNCERNGQQRITLIQWLEAHGSQEG